MLVKYHQVGVKQVNAALLACRPCVLAIEVPSASVYKCSLKSQQLVFSKSLSHITSSTWTSCTGQALSMFPLIYKEYFYG